MTGFNMPPGCSPNDIPGNRPEDTKREELWNQFYEILIESGVAKDTPETEAAFEKLEKIILQVERDGYTDGYGQAIADQGERLRNPEED